jgi:hypothetical protein
LQGTNRQKGCIKSKGLVVEDKTKRVANFHRKTVESFIELMAGAGINHPSKINRRSISRRILMNQVKRYDKIYPYLTDGLLLSGNILPEDWQELMSMSSADSFNCLVKS